MKKYALIFISIITFYACLDTDEPNYTYDFVKIDSAETPASFTFGQTDTVKIKYTLPNNCYTFDKLYYEYKDTTRVVAVTAQISLDAVCTEQTREEEYSFPITVIQKEDYVFKFYKGKDTNGENIFDEVVVPVNL